MSFKVPLKKQVKLDIRENKAMHPSALKASYRDPGYLTRNREGLTTLQGNTCQDPC